MKTISVLATIVGIITAHFIVAAEPSRPNILVIIADDLGYGETEGNNPGKIPMPHIESIARNGVRFSNGYVTAPVCSPSRAGLFTGRYQTRFGYELNVTGKQNLEENIGLPVSEKTLASVLKDAGYTTGLVGKWHLGTYERFHPLQRGFDEFFGFLHEGHFYVPPPYAQVTSFLRTNSLPPELNGRKTNDNVVWSTHLRSNEPQYDDHNPILRGRQKVIEKKYLTDALTREATQFLERHRRESFFLCLSYNAPHSPMQATEKYLKRFSHVPDLQRRVFAAMVANMDDSVGAVLQKLRTLKLEDNTLIFFLSDNGGPTAELTSKNQPLRGGKGNLWEGGIRVPFFVQWPGKIPAGKVYENPVISLDIFATSITAGGGAPPEMDGVNLLPYLRGEKTNAPHSTLFWRYGQNIALREGDWKLVKQIEKQRSSAQEFELFNLANDPSEQINLGESEPQRMVKLQKSLESWNAQMIPPIWSPARK